MMAMESAASASPYDVKLTLDLKRLELDIRFPLSMWNEERNLSVVQKFRFRLPISCMKEIYEEQKGKNRVLIIPMDGPPQYLRKIQDGDSTHNNERTWHESKMWYRQTDITHLRGPLKTAPVALRKKNPVIDIGRWTTYRLEFGPSKTDMAKYDEIIEAMTDWNIRITKDRVITVLEKQQPTLWDIIDPPSTSSPRANASPRGLLNKPVPLSFEVRYQLEACLSNNILNEHNVTRDFVERLAAMDKTRAKNILEVAMDKKRRFYEPMDIFKLPLGKKAVPKEIPAHCVYSRAANITPSTVTFASPFMEISNRVVRDHIKFSDRFLRVKFTDEKSEGRLGSREGDADNEVFTRIWRTLRNGITIGDRHYEFLAFGNSQFREHGAYFFAPVQGQSEEGENRTPSDIREWMGDFSEIHEVARYASRMGQCFSTTRAVTSVKAEISGHEDVMRNGYNFTDGVGKISPMLARQVAEEFGHPNAIEDPPSLFQFRLGGCKGVLAVSPDLVGQEIHVRRSQDKFPAPNDGLEIIKWSQFATATLNRQLIIVLDSLGVPSHVFMNKLRNQLSDLTKAMTSEDVALRLLQRHVDCNQVTLTLATMIVDGFMEVKEPFLMSVMRLWRTWSIKYLKDKAKLFIGDGAFLLGCVDETASLHGHFYSEQTDSPSTLPEIFVQISDPDHEGRYKVIEGICIVARNPSLHPGDIRVVRAVNNAKLHHLKNVIVFPQTGDRDIPNMCSGGDLDGDDYLVVWDEELVPRIVNHPPMDFTPPGRKVVDEVMMEDIARFFVEYIKNDSLGRIAVAHLASADFEFDGVMSERCKLSRLKPEIDPNVSIGIALAELHSTAVDYPKSGVAARMTQDMAPKRYPHFLPNKHRSKDRIYVSKKIVGQLYDAVEEVNFLPLYDAPFDSRILDAYKLDPALLNKAAALKELYDMAIRRMMAQHSIKTEFEVWSTFILEHNNEVRDYQLQEDFGRMGDALKKRFQKLCYEEAAGGFNEGSHDHKDKIDDARAALQETGKVFNNLGPFVAAMYTVTAREMQAALEVCQKTKVVGDRTVPCMRMNPESMPLMSFPWIFPRELGLIASGDKDRLEGLVVQHQVPQKHPSHAKKNKPTAALLGDWSREDELFVDGGIVKHGDLLDLFGDSGKAGVHEQHASAPAGKDTLKDVSTMPTEPTQISEAHLAKPVSGKTAAPEAKSKGDAASAITPADLQVKMGKSMSKGRREVKQSDADKDAEGLYTDDGPYPPQASTSAYLTANLDRTDPLPRQGQDHWQTKSPPPFSLPPTMKLENQPISSHGDEVKSTTRTRPSATLPADVTFSSTSPNEDEDDEDRRDYLHSVLSDSAKSTAELVLTSPLASVASVASSARATPAPDIQADAAALPIPPPINFSRTWALGNANEDDGVPFVDVMRTANEDDTPMVAVVEQSEPDTRRILGVTRPVRGSSGAVSRAGSRMPSVSAIGHRQEAAGDGKGKVDAAGDGNDDDGEEGEEVVIPAMKKGKSSWDMLKRFA